MNKKELIKRAYNKIILKKLEKHMPRILKLGPENLSQILLKIKQSDKLDDDIFGDFIQEILLKKYKIHEKNPDFKPVILNFLKENHIRGIQFPYI